MEEENIAVSLCVIIIILLRQFSGSKETGDPIPFLSFKIVWGTLIPEDILFLVQSNNSMVSGTENSISGFSFAGLGICITIKLLI